ncbi:MAG TPA: hypothetical protein VFP58_12685, partial [Candidatus Eisenbacteria bacterium]|nr:hypothetical protein [Candidatus Eisenbacteria bacterium]
MILEMLKVSVLGGTLAADRSAGWNFMLSQPIVGACLAGALVHPGAHWELYALRIPIGVGAILQLLLTDASLPAAQRQHDTATAGVVGSTVSILAMSRLHGALPATAGGALWVVVGVVAGLLAAIAGGWVLGFHRRRNVADTRRATELATEGDAGGFALLYCGGLLRVFLLGALWSWAASLAGVAACLWALPRLAPLLGARDVGILFAGLLGCGLAAAWHAHVRGRPGAPRWAAL